MWPRGSNRQIMCGKADLQNINAYEVKISYSTGMLFYRLNAIIIFSKLLSNSTIWA